MSGEGLVLQAARGDLPVRSCEAGSGPISIGSWAGATLRLPDAELQPVEVVLDPDGPGRWRLISLNPEGCSVNGNRVRRAQVTTGDRMAVGAYDVMFSGAAPLAIASAPVAVIGGRALRAILKWHGTRVDERVLSPGDLLIIGGGPQASLQVPTDEEESWVAAANIDGVWHVVLDGPARAVSARDDRPLLSAAARTDWLSIPRGSVAGRLWAPIPEGGRIRLDAGSLSIELDCVDAQQTPVVDKVPLWATEGGQIVTLTAMVVACLVAMFRITPQDTPDASDLGHQKSLIAAYQRPPPPPEPLSRVAKTEHESVTNEGAERSREEEGQAGRPDAADRQTRRAGPRSDADVVRNQALLRALSSGATAQLLSGGTLRAADSIGHLDGPEVGDAQGALGLGLRGAGSGGGGLSADTVGVGPIGTKGVGLGAASAAGKVGRGGQSDLSMNEPASVQGGLDREVIRRVILSHRAQVRYCYEKQLSVTPDLAGKVMVEFVIGGDGAVTSARPSDTTLSDPEVGRCIVEKVKTWTFPKPKGGGVVVVTYPFLFKPAGQGAN
jgi:hypothetical protein